MPVFPLKDDINNKYNKIIKYNITFNINNKNFYYYFHLLYFINYKKKILYLNFIENFFH